MRHPCEGGGLILQAGPRPDPCDANRPGPAAALLRAVNRAIKPVRTTRWWTHNQFDVDEDRATGWFSRMDE